MENLNQYFEAMVEHGIACPQAGYSYDEAVFSSIAEYEAVTGQKFIVEKGE